MAGFRAGAPHIEDRIHRGILVHEDERTAGHEHQHDGLAGGLQCLEQLTLRIGNGRIRPGRPFAVHVGGLTDARHDDIRRTRTGDRLGDQFALRTGMDRRRLEIAHEHPHQAVAHGLFQVRIHHQPAALGVARPGRRLGDPLPERDRLVAVGGHGPGAVHRSGVVRKRPHHGDAGVLAQRQHAVVLQQHQALLRHFPGESPVLRGIDLRRKALLVEIAERILEEAQAVFRLQDAAAGTVDVGFADAPLCQGLLQRAHEAVGIHVHVQARLQRTGGHFLQVADPVGHLLHHGGGVGDDEAVEAPAVAEQLLHQVTVHRSGDALEFVEGGHIAGGAGFGSRLVGIQVAVERLLAAQEHGIVVPARLGRAI